MEVILVLSSLFVLGALVGGITGVALIKWPAKSVIGSALKGAALAIGVLFIAVLFLTLIAFVLLSSMEDGIGS